MKEKFLDYGFSAASLTTLDEITTILSEYEQGGYDLSLRQLYYQLVARDKIPNSLKSYKRIGELVNNARNAGLIDWRMITDRNRERVSVSHWSDPAEIVKVAANQFRIDKWARQPVHIELMVEKQALEGVLVPVCERLDIAFTANKGYSSSTMMYEAAKRLAKLRTNKDLYILYLGDHDPSGIDMTRDVRERLELYSRGVLNVERLALNMDQVQTFNPPENPAKVTDSRYDAYVVEFGPSSWELDAIEPRQLDRIVTDFVEGLRDEDLWAEAVEEEEEMRAELQAFVEEYNNR